MEKDVAKKVMFSGFGLVGLWLVVFLANAPTVTVPHHPNHDGHKEAYYSSCLFSDYYNVSGHMGGFRCPGDGKIPYILIAGIVLAGVGVVFRKSDK